MSLATALVIFLLQLILEIGYFKIANLYNIIDKPNHRSSHTQVTVRGGGIIFSLALLICPFFFGIQYPLFLVGLLLISLVSFIDDVVTLNNRVRIVVHLVAAALLVLQLDIFHQNLYYVPIALFLIIGLINAVNFMDGINGITGIYALITLGTFYVLNLNLNFTNTNYLLASIISVVVFGIFNFRRKARCFAGDVGSVGIAFIIVFFLLQLIIKTQNIGYIFLVLVYGLDTATTIFFRICRKENITQAHRSHFYQFLANEKGLSHLYVSVIYGLSQLLINIVIVRYVGWGLSLLLLLLVTTTLIFLLLRFYTEGRKRLLGS